MVVPTVDADDAVDAVEPDDASGEAPAVGGPWACRVALAATLAPFAVAVVVLLVVVGGDYHPWADQALAELRTRDLGRHPVQVGPFSRDDWYHPGPALFYVLALPYRLTGGASVGILLGAVLVNGTAVAGMALVARQLGGRAVMLATLLCSGALLRALGPDFLRDPWNPSVTVLPFGLLVFLAWAMTCGRTWALPAAAAVASFAAQTHIGYVVLALPLLAWGAAWLAVLAARTGVRTPVEARALARAGALTAVVLAVMWAPPLLQELRGDPGNLTAIWRYFASHDLPGHSLLDGLRVLATQFALPPEWIAGSRPLTLTSEPTVLYLGAPVPWLLAPLALAAVVLVRRGGPPARRLLLTLGLAAGLGVVSVARTTGLAHAYRMQWTHVVAMAAGMATCWAAWLVLRPHVTRLSRLDRSDRPAHLARPGRLALVTGRRTTLGGTSRTTGTTVAAGVVLAAVVALAAVNAAAAAGAGVPDEDEPLSPGPVVPAEAIGALTRAVEAELPPGGGPVVVLPSPGWASGLFVNGVVLGLERAGVDARVTPDQIHLGEHRHHRGGPLRAEVVVATDHDIDALAADPSLTEVARWGRVPPPPGPYDPTARVEQLLAGGTIDQVKSFVRETADRSADLRRPWSVHAVAAFVRVAR